MKITVIFVVPGEPVAQGRPRFRRVGNHVSTYDPKMSKDYKKTVQAYAKMAYGLPPISNAVQLTVNVYKSIPKSFSKAKRESAMSGELRPSVKPDWDNYAKGVADALNGIVYADDGLVVTAMVNKWYAVNPRIEVMVQEV